MKKILVYCGESITNKCGPQLHPVSEVREAEKAIHETMNGSSPFGLKYIHYSNSPDFVSGIKYMAEKNGIEVEFFLDGVSQGNDIDKIFEDFNRAIEMINKLGI